MFFNRHIIGLYFSYHALSKKKNLKCKTKIPKQLGNNLFVTSYELSSTYQVFYLQRGSFNKAYRPIIQEQGNVSGDKSSGFRDLCQIPPPPPRVLYKDVHQLDGEMVLQCDLTIFFSPSTSKTKQLLLCLPHRFVQLGIFRNSYAAINSVAPLLWDLNPEWFT